MRSTRGYYGQLYSGDDFYALSSGLTVQETTNSSLETETGLGFGACSGLVVVFTIRLGGWCSIGGLYRIVLGPRLFCSPTW